MRYIVEHEDSTTAPSPPRWSTPAVKGHVRLVEEEGGWFSAATRRRIERLAASRPTPLAAAEQAIAQRAGRARRIDRHGAEEPRDIHRRAGRRLERRFQADAYEGKMFLRNYGWIGAARRDFRRSRSGWPRRPSRLATGAGDQLLVLLSAVGATIVALVLLCRLAARANPRSATACCMLVSVAFGGLRVADRLPAHSRRADHRQLAAAGDPACWPAVRDQQLSAGCRRRPRKAARVLDRIAGFKPISVDHRARAARPDAGAQGHACNCSSAICLMPSRWASRTAGPTAYRLCSPRPHRLRAQPGLRLVFGLVEPVERHRRLRRFDVGSSLASTVSSASTAPGSSQRLGRRRVVGWRRRRRRRRRLVAQPLAGRRKHSDRLVLDRSRLGCRSKPSRSASFIEGSFSRCDDRRDRRGPRRRRRPMSSAALPASCA